MFKASRFSIFINFTPSFTLTVIVADVTATLAAEAMVTSVAALATTSMATMHHLVVVSALRAVFLVMKVKVVFLEGAHPFKLVLEFSCLFVARFLLLVRVLVCLPCLLLFLCLGLCSHRLVRCSISSFLLLFLEDLVIFDRTFVDFC